MILCTMPQCQTTAGCVCGLANARIGQRVPIRPIDDEKVREIMAEIGVRFATFGGGVEPENPHRRNPITAALKDKPLQFAGGVNVESVVRLVLALGNCHAR